MFERLNKVDSSAAAAFDRYSARPCAKTMKGYKLRDEEFYLIAAMGAISGIAEGLGISPMTDAEAFAMMHYEDDSKRGYINPEEGPREPGRVRLRFGIRRRKYAAVTCGRSSRNSSPDTSRRYMLDFKCEYRSGPDCSEVFWDRLLDGEFNGSMKPSQKCDVWECLTTEIIRFSRGTGCRGGTGDDTSSI
jgi:hypothetical protein